jgi:hypothetical protein
MSFLLFISIIFVELVGIFVIEGTFVGYDDGCPVG